ncbi:MAG: HAMP domain-containing protein, partial [Gemmataceae bacterium]
MFRRLFTAFALLTAGLLAGAAAFPHGLALLLVAGLAASAGLSYWLSVQLARPIKDLIAAVENLSKGNGTARVFPTDRDEVSVLGETFNRMGDRLGRRIGALEEDRQQL